MENFVKIFQGVSRIRSDTDDAVYGIGITHQSRPIPILETKKLRTSRGMGSRRFVGQPGLRRKHFLLLCVKIQHSFFEFAEGVNTPSGAFRKHLVNPIAGGDDGCLDCHCRAAVRLASVCFGIVNFGFRQIESHDAEDVDRRQDRPELLGNRIVAIRKSDARISRIAERRRWGRGRCNVCHTMNSVAKTPGLSRGSAKI